MSNLSDLVINEKKASKNSEMYFESDLDSVFQLRSYSLLSLKKSLKQIPSVFKNIKNIFNNKKNLIIIGSLIIIWFFVLTMEILKINFPFLDLISFLSFAKLGINSSIVGILGGILGKTIFSYFLVKSFNSPKYLFKDIKPGIKKMLKIFKNIDKYNIYNILLGIGIAFIFYNFLSMNFSIQQGIIAIVSFIITLKSLVYKKTILKRLILTFIKRKENKNYNKKIEKIILGISLGFILVLVFSLINIFNLGYILGFFFIISSFFIRIVMKKQKVVKKDEKI